MGKPLVQVASANVFIPGVAERKYVLKDINWVLYPAGHCAIYGRNGSGKSTFLRLLHGDLWPDKGAIEWLDENGHQDASRITGQNVTGLVSPAIQEGYQRNAWDISVRHFLLAALTEDPFTMDATEHETSIVDCLKAMGAAQWLEMRLPTLSQGQMRLALLARELLRRPRVLLLDEFDNGLDAFHRDMAMAALDAARDRITFVFTSHRKDRLPKWIIKNCYLDSGHLTDMMPQAHACHLSSEIAHCKPSAASSPHEPLFELFNASVYIDRELVLKNICWQVFQGDHWRIKGANGSGKSTLLRLLAGDELAAAGGHVLRWNCCTGRWAETLNEIRENICLVSDQAQALYGYPLTALELVCSGFDNTTGIWREIGTEEKREALALIKRFFPEADAEIISATSIRRLSTGQLRRLYLARAMARNPWALLLDEPCTGLDAESRKLYLELLAELVSIGHKGRKPTVIFVSHHDEDLPGFIRREATLDAGRLITL